MPIVSLPLVDELLELSEVALPEYRGCLYTALGAAVSAIRYESVGTPPAMYSEVDWIRQALRSLPLRRSSSDPLICGCCYTNRGHVIARGEYALAYLRSRAREQLS